MPSAAHGRVLVVDDLEANVTLIGRVLVATGFEVFAAFHPDDALDAVKREQPDVILMDVRMPGSSGFDLCRALKRNAATRLIPVVLMTAASNPEDRLEAIEAGADDFVAKPLNVEELKARLRSLVRLKRFTDDLESAEQVIVSLALTDAILLKPGVPTPAEFEVMKTHPLIGARLCGELRSLARVRPIVRWHHERLDGLGYPDGLERDAIPLLAQITGVVDVYDALTTARPYRAALPHGAACAELRREVTRGWRRSDVVEPFVELVESRRLGTQIAGVGT